MPDWSVQSGYGVRFDWGAGGAAELGPRCAALVVVDVLSFTTSVTVAVEAGTRVFPYPWRDDTAAGFARGRRAALAVGRSAVSASSPWSLSPAALRRAPFTPRLVLPSPNGSTIAATAAAGTATVVAASLRNATAVGHWLAARGLGVAERPVAVIAAGERRPDGSLRPALEDLLGAGAVIAALRARAGAREGTRNRRAPAAPPREAADAAGDRAGGTGAGTRHRPGPPPYALSPSPEAELARAGFAATADVAAAVRGSVSGRELAVTGFAADVEIAVDADACDVVPVLESGAFGAARTADPPDTPDRRA